MIRFYSYHEETGEADYKEVVKLFRNGKDFNTTDVINASEGVKDWINVRVTKFNTNEELDLITNDRIICTLEHPFYVLNADSDRTKVDFVGRDEDSLSGSWIASKDLRVGDKLLLSNGESGIISSVEVEHYDEAQATYNFEVADFHTYYVGKEGILVHNSCLIIDENGVKIYDNYPRDHAPAHLHVGGPKSRTRIGLVDGKIKPIFGSTLTTKQSLVINANKKFLIEYLGKIVIP